jgi:hypothetical protein
MAKTKISSTDLIWVFHEKLKAFDDNPAKGVVIAVVPTRNGNWAAVTTQQVRMQRPLWAQRIQAVEKQLRKTYVLAKD